MEKKKGWNEWSRAVRKAKNEKCALKRGLRTQHKQRKKGIRVKPTVSHGKMIKPFNAEKFEEQARGQKHQRSRIRDRRVNWEKKKKKKGKKGNVLASSKKKIRKPLEMRVGP